MSKKTVKKKQSNIQPVPVPRPPNGIQLTDEQAWQNIETAVSLAHIDAPMQKAAQQIMIFQASVEHIKRLLNKLKEQAADTPKPEKKISKKDKK